MERIPLEGGGHLAADVDRRDPARWWFFLPGFGSVRGGAKASAFRAAAGEAGVSFASFDFRGHGDSSGAIADLTVGGMLDDVDATLRALAPRREETVLVGSSLGGLVAAWWCATRTPPADACVLLAPAFGFMARYFERIGPDAVAAWEREGVHPYVGEWMSFPLRWSIAKDALSRDEAVLAATYRTDTLVLQGLLDDNVPWRVPVAFAERCPHRPVDVVLLSGGDHRLTTRLDDLPRLARDFLRSRGLRA
jgi:alpha-beta hydrolase superfamily lysophospholipase